MLLKTWDAVSPRTTWKNKKSCIKRRYQRERAVGVCGWWVGGCIWRWRQWTRGVCRSEEKVDEKEQQHGGATTADSPPPSPGKRNDLT